MWARLRGEGRPRCLNSACWRLSSALGTSPFGPLTSGQPTGSTTGDGVAVSGTVVGPQADQGRGGGPGRKLRKLIWDPVEPHLGKPEVVLVSPDGPLNFLPFAALSGKKTRHLPGPRDTPSPWLPRPVLLPDLLAQKPARPEERVLAAGRARSPSGKRADTPAPAGKLPTVPTNGQSCDGDRERVRRVWGRQFTKAFETDRKTPPPSQNLRRTRPP